MVSVRSLFMCLSSRIWQHPSQVCLSHHLPFFLFQSLLNPQQRERLFFQRCHVLLPDSTPLRPPRNGSLGCPPVVMSLNLCFVFFLKLIFSHSRVMLLEYPTLKNIGTQALVNVDGCHIHWHPQGDYLGVKVDRHGKTKKQAFTSFEFFRVRYVKLSSLPASSHPTKPNPIVVSFQRISWTHDLSCSLFGACAFRPNEPGFGQSSVSSVSFPPCCLKWDF